MGRLSHDSSSPRSSIDTTLNGEGLPLYSDITVTSPSALTAPSEKATPDEVREFLVQLLTQNRGLHPDHARRVAAKWTLGTGRELTSYPPQLYAEIFGLEDAWMVYKEAKLFIRTEKKKGKPKDICKHQPSFEIALLPSRDHTDMFWQQTGVAVGIFGLIFGAAAPTFFLTDLDDHTVIKIISAFVSLVSGFIFACTLIIAVFDNTSEETKIENELTNGLKKSKD